MLATESTGYTYFCDVVKQRKIHLAGHAIWARQLNGDIVFVNTILISHWKYPWKLFAVLTLLLPR